MTNIWIPGQLPKRKAFLLTTPAGQVVIPLYKMGKDQLAEIIDAQLEKSGVPKEERQKAVEEAERQYESRIKTYLVRQEIRRRLDGQIPLMRKRGGRWQFIKPGY